MSDERKAQMREIAAEEYDDDGHSAGSDIRRDNRSHDRVAHRVLRIIDRIAELPPEPTRHDGDCTIHISLDNGRLTDGFCTCGYGLSLARKGDRSELLSDVRLLDAEEKAARKVQLQPEPARQFYKGCKFAATVAAVQSSKGEGRVEEVQAIIEGCLVEQRWGGVNYAMATHIDDRGVSVAGGTVTQFIAECIVATEPRAMSREEVVEVVAKDFVAKGWDSCADDLRKNDCEERKTAVGEGAVRAIDALAGQIPASNEAEEKKHERHASHLIKSLRFRNGIIAEQDIEIEAWKKKYERQVEHSHNLEETLGKKTAKIGDLEQEVVKLKCHAFTPAKGPDRLDKPIALCCTLEKIQRMAEAHLARMAEEKLAATE